MTELFSLLAKLTLDKKEFEKGIDEAKSGASIDLPDAELGIDKSEFDQGIEDAETEHVDLDDAELGMDHSEFDKGVEDVEAESETFSSTIGGIFSELKGVIAASGIAAVVTGIVTTLKEGVELAKNHGDTIDKQSQKMKISAKEYQEWSYALELSGASIDDLNRGLRNWQQSVGDEKKTAELGDAFTKLGMDANKALDQIANGENLDSVLNEAMMALANYDGSDRGTIAEALFGRGANGLNALFNQTAEELADVKKEAEDLGLVMTDQEVKNAAAYTDATTRLEKSVQAFKESIVADILPLLTDAANEAAKIVAIFNWRSGDDSFSETLERIDKEGATALISMQKNEAQADSLIDKLADMGSYWTLDDNGKKTWDTLANELIRLFPELDKKIDADKDAIYRNRDAIKANVEEWTKLEEQRLLSQNLEEKRTAIAKQYADALDKEVEAELKDTEAAGKKVEAYAAIEDFMNNGRGKAYKKSDEPFVMTDELWDEWGGNIYNWMNELANPSQLSTVKDWRSTIEEAENLRTEAKEMTEQADKASENYTKYAETLAEKLGITISDTKEATTEAEKLKTAIDNIPEEKRIYILQEYEEGHPHAIGSNYIPYDNYAATLHRGEMVLTATEARQYRNGSNNGGSSNMEDRIINAIQNGMKDVTVKSYLNGKDITDEVNRQNTNTLKAKRYTT